MLDGESDSEEPFRCRKVELSSDVGEWPLTASTCVHASRGWAAWVDGYKVVVASERRLVRHLGARQAAGEVN